MKKSNFFALMSGMVATVLFSLGMCMTLITEWNSFNYGLIFGIVGIVLGVVTVIVWRKAEKKKPIKLNKKTVAIWSFGIFGSLVLGLGMCFCMVWNNIILGTLIGLVGILLLLSLIPLIKGFK